MITSYLTRGYPARRVFLPPPLDFFSVPKVAKYVNRRFSKRLELDNSSFSYIMLDDGGKPGHWYLSSYRNTVQALWWALPVPRATENVRLVGVGEGISESLPTDNRSKAGKSFDHRGLAPLRCVCGLVPDVGGSGSWFAPDDPLPVLESQHKTVGVRGI